MTFICILVPRTILDLNFLIKISFQGCPEPFYYTKENTKKYKGKLHLCIFELLRQKKLYKSNFKQLAVFLWSLCHHMSSQPSDIYWLVVSHNQKTPFFLLHFHTFSDGGNFSPVTGRIQTNVVLHSCFIGFYRRTLFAW